MMMIIKNMIVGKMPTLPASACLLTYFSHTNNYLDYAFCDSVQNLCIQNPNVPALYVLGIYL